MASACHPQSRVCNPKLQIRFVSVNFDWWNGSIAPDYLSNVLYQKNIAM